MVIDDLIDKSPLSRIIASIFSSKKDNELTTLIQKSLSPQVVDSKFISYTAWNFDVTGTIYSAATPREVLEGWILLINENVLLSVLARVMGMFTVTPTLEIYPKAR